MSQPLEQSQTASDYIETQLQLEQDAREVLPYQFDTCTKPLGSLRQSVFACLTCTPPPASASQQFTPAGICYSCSISCHGEHTLVELFCKRNFVCDCGTTKFANSQTPCALRLNPATGRKGGVINEEARLENKYNQNFQGKFCGCGEDYDPDKEKGTMFQCLGLTSVEDGGCGEDWWHPECLMGLPRRNTASVVEKNGGGLETVKEEPEATDNYGTSKAEPEDLPPEGFPDEDDFDHFICYKCVNAVPWIKQYAGADGFLPALTHSTSSGNANTTTGDTYANSLKRKADDEVDDEPTKRAKNDAQIALDTKSSINGVSQIIKETANDELIGPATEIEGAQPLHQRLPAPTTSEISLFLKEDFREHFCRCQECFPRLAKHPQLLEEEDSYEPPISESDDQDEVQSVAGRSVNSGSLLERGEAALSSMDRVRAIEGIMAYNHVRDKVKEFLQPFAEDGRIVGAEDIKAYFARLRGDQKVEQ